MIILYAIISVFFIVTALGVITVRRNKKLIADAEKSEVEHKEWMAKRRAGMTGKQLEDERLYFASLRNTPIEQRRNYRTGNSLSKDLLGFDLLPK